MRSATLTQEQFNHFLEISIPAFAQSKVESLEWSIDTALDQSRMAFNQLLPLGLNTSDQLLWGLYEKDQYVGWAWIQLNFKALVKTAFVYEFRIFDEHQNQGYGKKALAMIFSALKEKEVQHLYLHVFGFNQKALHLYQNSGFEVVDLTLRKIL
jgi:ribosomal protein S18 acetylase RimI-like enzyme